MSSPRWPIQIPPGDIDSAAMIHARVTQNDDGTLCERDGRVLPFDTITLALDLARSEPSMVTRPVDCPECLEWIHA